MIRSLFSILILLFVTGSALAVHERGRITDDGLVVAYTITVAKNETLRVKAIRTSGDLELFAAVTTTNGRTIIRQSGDENGNLEFSHTFDEGGDYQLLVTRTGGSDGSSLGDYVISYDLTSVDNAPQENIPLLQSPSDPPYVVVYQTGSLRGSINTEDYLDAYYLFLPANRKISVGLRTDDSALKPLLALVSADGRVLTRGELPDSNTPDLALVLTYTVEEDGWYKIIVSRTDPKETASTGSYILDINLQS